MRLGWDEIRRRAREFSDEWRDAHYEKGETQSFYNDFFQIFGIKRRTVAAYERRVESLDGTRRGFIDLFWPGTLIVEQKSGGLDLSRAQGQALDYFSWLPENQQPRYVLTCDFQQWNLLDLDTNTTVKFRLNELHRHVEAFDFMLGRRRTFVRQADVTIKAAELMGRLHDALEASGYRGHDLEQLLVRLLFCMFADRTGIFQPADIFLQLIENDTRDDGADVGRTLMELFDVLDTDRPSRQRGLSGELDQFDYINGALFSGRLRTPVFDAEMRGFLLDAARHDWSKVSPAIFGSLFQSVMSADKRRKIGAHYTSEANILKVIGPLFLDELRAELATIERRRSGRDAALDEFVRKLSRLTFLDPACGCGNFLVVAYRELRRLELDALELRWPKVMTDTGEARRQGIIDPGLLSQMKVGQFFGIEIEEFPARIAEVAMWMADHIANNELGVAFSTNYARIPLRDSAHIRHADALATDWGSVCPPERLDYIMGNPPFVGFVMRSEAQQAQFTAVTQKLGASGSRLDYVTAWFLKSAEMIAENSRICVALVATNSVSQGEQVSQLWPALFHRWNLEIAFAHRTFAWTSEARGKAHVHVVVIGLTHRGNEPAEKRLFSYPDIHAAPVETRHKALTAYLFDAASVSNRHLVVRRESGSLGGAPRISVGTKPVDDGHYIFNAVQRSRFLEREPSAARAIRPFLGGYEFINGEHRWILHIADLTPTEQRSMPEVMERITAVRAFRSTSSGNLAKSLAMTPSAYHVTVVPEDSFLVFPEASSSRREYVPIGWIEPPAIPSNQLLVVQHASLFLFGVMTARAHMAWLAQIGGRLKSDFRYSSGLVYNTFPWPDANSAQRERVETLAQAVLDARAEHPTSSLADLYDPDTMPADLRRAHAALDLAVDRLYRREPFASDRDRVEHLFGRYEALVNPLATSGVKANKRVARALRQPGSRQ